MKDRKARMKAAIADGELANDFIACWRLFKGILLWIQDPELLRLITITKTLDNSCQAPFGR
ncbi:hypothetical protein D3C87_1695230 [compost metagenome]